MRNAPNDPEFSSSVMVRSPTQNYNRPNKEPISFIITHLICSFVMISLADKEEVGSPYIWVERGGSGCAMTG